MRRLDGLELTRAECERLALVVRRAADMLADADDHRGADDVARLAVALAAVADPVSDVSDPVSDVSDRLPAGAECVTLAEWAATNAIGIRTARRWARAGRIPATMRGGRWMVPCPTSPTSPT